MAVIINSSDMIYRVVFKSPTQTTDESGGLSNTYTEAFTTLAEVDEVSQSRERDSNYTGIVGSKDFYIRYAEARKDINSQWLLNYNGKDYTIHEVEFLNEEKKFIRIRGKVKNG